MEYRHYPSTKVTWIHSRVRGFLYGRSARGGRALTTQVEPYWTENLQMEHLSATLDDEDVFLMKDGLGIVEDAEFVGIEDLFLWIFGIEL